MNQSIKLFCSVLLLWLGSACSSFHIVNSWKATCSHPIENDKMLVLGLNCDSSLAICKMMEDQMVNDLRGLGYHPVSALSTYGAGVFTNLQQADSLSKADSNGAETIITIKFADSLQDEFFLPTLLVSQYLPGPGDFLQYYDAIDNVYFHYGVYVTLSSYFWKTELYDVSSGKVVFSVQTESLNPVSYKAMAHQYAKLITKNMLKNNLLVNLKQQSLQQIPPKEARRPF